MEDDTVYEYKMPVERFTGFRYLYDCSDMYASFRRKDSYSRKIVRMQYTRLLPVMFEIWREHHEEYRKKAYSFHHYFQKLMRKCFEALLEIQNMEAAEQHQEVCELLASNLKRKDSLDEDLSEDMIYYLKNEKRRLVHQAKREAISQEVTCCTPRNKYLRTGQLSSNKREWLFMPIALQELTTHVESIDRIEEQKLILSEITETENEKWSKTINSIKTLFALAVNRITSVYESVQKHRTRTKYFFSGVRHTRTLRRAERRRWKVFRWIAKPKTLSRFVDERRTAVAARLKREQALLLSLIGKADSSDMTDGYLDIPPSLIGTFFNLRRMQVEKALNSADGLIRVAKRQLGSSMIGFRVSSWLFEARCIHLPKQNAARLPSTPSYWRNIHSLNSAAQQQGSDYKIKAI
eukprot:754890-Hanusia_phi.AAC.3